MSLPLLTSPKFDIHQEPNIILPSGKLRVARDTYKSRVVHRTGGKVQSNTVLARIQVLEASSSTSASLVLVTVDAAAEDVDMNDWVDVEPSPLPLPPRSPIPGRTSSGQKAAKHKNSAWAPLMSLLEHPFTEYRQASYAQPPSLIPDCLAHICVASCGKEINAMVQCLYISHFQQVQVSTCSCIPVMALLVRHGVFPASPTRPRTGVSIELLEVYRALFERSCDAIIALATAVLYTVYKQRGY
ncbi:hypothetical protein K438DRAFT_2006904 [Mycena galopus ATCC 62051]|nr:hypothetical protein K438DRAFT_2006904 [Mycena galopus ATCC 62051]